MRQAFVEVIVGIFIVIAFLCLLFLAFRVSGLQTYSGRSVYYVKAHFENIGDLAVRAPVSVAGVKVGQIKAIDLNPTTFNAIVTMAINKKYNHIPVDSTASIYTAGLLGSNYISISPGYAGQYLRDGSSMKETNSALILQNLIGQLLYSFSGGGANKHKKSTT